ncbi:MAG: hypothetical protein H7Y09_08850 [Chitinophagaceae bacterium]|nr:hypothetical protein [Anaerolineae bacterium]
MNKLTSMLLEAGLMQFGLFDMTYPMKINLELLPSYPDILKYVALEANRLIAPLKVDQLVCRSDSMPFAVALGMTAEISVVYSRGSNDIAVHDLVGAYDVGHPAVLIVNSWQDDATNATFKLIADARRVGLEISTIMALLDFGVAAPENVRVISLLNLQSAVAEMVEYGKLPKGQGQAVLSALMK